MVKVVDASSQRQQTHTTFELNGMSDAAFPISRSNLTQKPDFVGRATFFYDCNEHHKIKHTMSSATKKIWKKHTLPALVVALMLACAASGPTL